MSQDKTPWDSVSAFWASNESRFGADLFFERIESHFSINMSDAVRGATEELIVFGQTADDIGSRVTAINMAQTRTTIRMSAEEMQRFSLETLRAEDKVKKLAGEEKKRDNAYKMTGELVKMAEKPVSMLVEAHVAGIYGKESGAMAGSMTSGAMKGAAAGVAFGIPGMIVGGAIGSAIGALEHGANVQKERNDAFEALVTAKRTSAVDYESNLLSSAEGQAARYQWDYITMRNTYGGVGGDVDEEALAAHQQWLIGLQRSTTLDYAHSTAMENTFASRGADMETVQQRVNTVVDIGAFMGLGNDAMVTLADFFASMSGTTFTIDALAQMEGLNIDATKYLTEALGISENTLKENIGKNLLTGDQVLDILFESLAVDYAGSMEERAGTLLGMTQITEAKQFGFDPDGLDEIVKTSTEMLTKQQEVYDHENYRAGISAQANLQMKSKAGQANEISKSLLSLYNDEDFEAVLAQGGEKASLAFWEAYYNGMNAYFSSDEYKKNRVQYEIDLVSTIAETTHPFWEDYGYNISQWIDKGMTKVKRQMFHEQNTQMSRDFVNSESFDPYASSAMGLAFVPYDNFPALLHEGERVLTASEARAYNARYLDGTGTAFVGVGGRSVGDVRIEVAGNTFVVREEADIDRIAEAIAQRFTQTLRVS